ncbi:MAG: hypothetical protein WCA78_00700 [Rhizomicrobium sp.]
MKKGGRYIDDGKGNVRRVDRNSDEHHQYPAAKPATGTKPHPATAGGGDEQPSEEKPVEQSPPAAADTKQGAK